MPLADDLAPNASGLDQLRAMIAAGGIAPIGRTLGFQLVEADDGMAAFVGTPGQRDVNLVGVRTVGPDRCYAFRR